MKKALSILAVLFVSVISTACINNLAIQELNNKAKAYMEAGDVEKAICRYSASLDLDSSVFETNYNLGVAYINAKKYNEAINVLQNAIKINSEFADAYYSLALAMESEADSILNRETQTEEEIVQAEQAAPQEITEADRTKAVKLLMDAIDNYNRYLAENPEAKDKDKVSAHIEEISRDLENSTTSNTDED